MYTYTVHARTLTLCTYAHTLMGNPGTKGVAKAMKKIAQGAQYKEGNTWFSQLTDKRKWDTNLEVAALIVLYNLIR